MDEILVDHLAVCETRIDRDALADERLQAGAERDHEGLVVVSNRLVVAIDLVDQREVIPTDSTEEVGLKAAVPPWELQACARFDRCPEDLAAVRISGQYVVDTVECSD